MSVNQSLSPYSVCTQFCIPHPEGDFLGKVNERTTPEEFDQLLTKYPTYKIDHCGPKTGTHALSRAATVGNVDLIYHIALRLNGKHLINIGSGGNMWDQKPNGWTPLYFVMSGCHPERKYEAAEALLALGADPNISTTEHGLDKTFPPYSTPLYLAAERGNLRVAKLLLLNGAVANPPPSSKGKETLERAELELRLAQKMTSISQKVFS